MNSGFSVAALDQAGYYQEAAMTVCRKAALAAGWILSEGCTAVDTAVLAAVGTDFGLSHNGVAAAKTAATGDAVVRAGAVEAALGIAVRWGFESG
jgi:hypothetical protein